MKICLVGAEFFHADRHDKHKSLFDILRTRLKLGIEKKLIGNASQIMSDHTALYPSRQPQISHFPCVFLDLQSGMKILISYWRLPSQKM
jgi:hypothetical protein